MRLRPLRVSRRNGITKIPNSPKITIYHIKTSIHAPMMRHSAIGASNSHLSQTFLAVVIFQMRAAEPEKDVGAEIMIFSDANLSAINYPFTTFISSANDPTALYLTLSLLITEKCRRAHSIFAFSTSRSCSSLVSPLVSATK